MKNDFICPKCKGYLNIDNNVVFATENKNGKYGLIFLHPEIGNYSVLKHPKYSFEEGENIEFYCPLCHSKLKSEKHRNLAMVVMTDNYHREFNVYFSQIAGEKSTYSVIGENTAIYGNDSKNYINFFNLSQNY